MAYWIAYWLFYFEEPLLAKLLLFQNQISPLALDENEEIFGVNRAKSNRRFLCRMSSRSFEFRPPVTLNMSIFLDLLEINLLVGIVLTLKTNG